MYKLLIIQIGFVVSLTAIQAEQGSTDDPPELIQARETHEQAIKKIEEPLRAKYINHLRKLQDDATKVENLELALAFKNERESLKALGMRKLDPKGCNFLYFQSIQAGSFTEIDNLKIKDLKTSKVTTYAFSMPDKAWLFGHRLESDDEAPIILDSPLGRIKDGTLKLECVGFQRNGAGAYNSATGATLLSQLPENFEIEFEVKRNQWAGHFQFILLPSTGYWHQVPSNRKLFAYALFWGGTTFGATSKFQNAMNAPVTGRSKHGLNVGMFQKIKFVKKSGNIKVYANDDLKYEDDLEDFNYSLTGTYAFNEPTLKRPVARGMQRDLPPQLVEARESYEQALDKACLSLKENYLKYLEKLQDTATKAGKLELALAYKRERESIQK